MGYMDNIAPKRENPASDRVGPAASVGSASAQQKSVDQASKFSSPDTGVNSKYNCGDVVKVQSNDKGTGVAGRPSSIGLASRDFTGPADENPSGSRNQTTATFRP
jgi:hypothetical protein